jgi:hypothetical protein
MISSQTPYKLAEIIRDTWPNLFYLKEVNKKHGSINTTTTKEGVV